MNEEVLPLAKELWLLLRKGKSCFSKGVLPHIWMYSKAFLHRGGNINWMNLKKMREGITQSCIGRGLGTDLEGAGVGDEYYQTPFHNILKNK